MSLLRFQANGIRCKRMARSKSQTHPPFFTSFPCDRYTTSSCFQFDCGVLTGLELACVGKVVGFRRKVFSRNVFVAFSFEPYLIPKPSEEKHGSR